METIDSSPLAPISPNLRKRVAPSNNTNRNEDEDYENTKPLNLRGTQFAMPTPPDTERSSNASPGDASKDNRAISPAPSSISTLSSVPASEIASTEVLDRPKKPPAKRRKLSPTEKIEKKREQESKALENEAKIKQKVEEKRVKAEEQEKKKHEKELEDERKAQKKREKELEDERKAQEKLKKERSQMRLGAFFQRPDTPTRSSISNGERGTGLARRKSISLEPFDPTGHQARRSASPSKGTPSKQKMMGTAGTPVVTKTSGSDYKRHFLPFVPPSHSSIAPEYVVSNQDDLAYWQGMFDGELLDPTFHEKMDLGIIQPGSSFDHLFKPQILRGRTVPSIRALVDRIQGTSNQPIDLTDDIGGRNPMQALQAVPRRHLQFHQDVRPPWFGTYTKINCPRKAQKLSRNPFTRVRTDTDYDYDSEAEWEEPEEGEDIDLEEDDEAESLGDADEMDEFLDDEDDLIKNKRKMIAGDLQPSSTGLCWEDSSGRTVTNAEKEQQLEAMHGLRIGYLIPGFTGNTIDPFCTTYWTNTMDPPGAPVVDSSSKMLINVPTPTRPALQDRINSNGAAQQQLIGAGEGMKGPITSLSTTLSVKRGPKAQSKMLSPQVMEEFKEAIVGSQLRKLDLQKGLKLRFPKLTNETIKDSLGSHFAQVGTSKAEKKWVYVEPS